LGVVRVEKQVSCEMLRLEQQQVIGCVDHVGSPGVLRMRSHRPTTTSTVPVG
jgi:hypothetical protein